MRTSCIGSRWCALKTLLCLKFKPGSQFFTPSILDNENTYNFNGTVHGEFGKNRWRTDTRFFFGLDRRDIYINPEITFIGWEPHEIYAAWHYFDGDDETIGGYWEDSSLLTLGLRTQF